MSSRLISSPLEYRPNHVVAFVRPKPKQPPNLATFAVPLQFNKLDLRDYLYHAYDVEVTSVRSFINQPAVRQKFGHVGKWYRPRSQKMMIAELVKPFVWPSPPAEEDREKFDHSLFKKMEAEREKHFKRQMDPANIPLRNQVRQSREREGLKAQAEEFLKSGGWTNGQNEGDKWKEVEEELKV